MSSRVVITNPASSDNAVVILVNAVGTGKLIERVKVDPGSFVSLGIDKDSTIAVIPDKE